MHGWIKKNEEFPRMKQAIEGDFRKQMYPAKHIEETIWSTWTLSRPFNRINQCKVYILLIFMLDKFWYAENKRDQMREWKEIRSESTLDIIELNTNVEKSVTELKAG